MAVNFINSFKHYFIEMAPALAIGFLLSGIIHEFIPDAWINKHLGGKGLKGVLWSTLVGTLIPVCCWGCLPIAVSFRKKGASLGPILAMLVATPATSINALIVTAKLLGLKFAVYLFFSVILMGITAGLIGNRIRLKKILKSNDGCNCGESNLGHLEPKTTKKPFGSRLVSVFRFAYIQMPKDIGKETLLGLAMAASVDSIMPVGHLVKHYLKGGTGYLFALIFGLVTYMCATMGVPLVDALIKQGLDRGAGFVLLSVGPITSYGTILVLRKEFGAKVLIIYLSLVSVMGLALGYLFTFI
ncbi:MAG: permease [Candidatus Omnitrophica bacterium]|nr:permease [Candidatus Omnitrophota bacterium]